MEADARLELVGVGVTLAGVPIVRRVDARFGNAEFVALVGPNGAGKTTLLRAIAGLVASSGEIRIGGATLHTVPPEVRARHIGYLPQGHQAHWPLAAQEIVALGRYPHGAGEVQHLSARDADLVADAMARTDTTALARRNIQTLSGGERARVMIARVLALGAPLILADEPTAALDPRHQLTIMETLKAETRRGVLVIAVTHDLVLAARFADRVIVIDKGRIVGDGAPAAVLTAPLMREVYGVHTRTVTVDRQVVPLPWGVA